jgi:hypothetical protein
MKIRNALLAGVLMCLSPFALANHDPDAAQMGHTRIDTNGDGLISQQEFMAHQQQVWNELPKNADGMVATKDMPTHHDRMMHKSGMTLQDDAPEGDQAKQDKVKPTDAKPSDSQGH